MVFQKRLTKLFPQPMVSELASFCKLEMLHLPLRSDAQSQQTEYIQAYIFTPTLRLCLWTSCLAESLDFWFEFIYMPLKPCFQLVQLKLHFALLLFIMYRISFVRTNVFLRLFPLTQGQPSLCEGHLQPCRWCDSDCHRHQVKEELRVLQVLLKDKTSVCCNYLLELDLNKCSKGPKV